MKEKTLEDKLNFQSSKELKDLKNLAEDKRNWNYLDKNLFSKVLFSWRSYFLFEQNLRDLNECFRKRSLDSLIRKNPKFIKQLEGLIFFENLNLVSNCFFWSKESHLALRNKYKFVWEKLL